MTTRMGVSLTVAVAFHIALLIFLELLVDVTNPLVPDYLGPIFVELEAMEPPPVAEPVAEPPVAEPPVVDSRQPAPSVAPASEPATGVQGAGQPVAPAAATGSSVRRTTAEQLREALDRLRPDTAEEPGQVATTTQAEDTPRFVREHTPSEAPPPSFTPNADAGQTAPQTGVSVGDVSPDTQGEAGPSLSYDDVDRALQGQGTESGATRVGGTAGSVVTPSGETTFAIDWENPSVAREPLSTPEPVLPGWVSHEGARLRLLVRFDLTADGFLTAVTIEETSGYTDVDASILQALRSWRFAPVSGAGVVRGRVPYVISPR